MKSYRDFASERELRSFYHLLTESKADGKDDQKVERTVFYNDNLEVQYAKPDEINNIFDHIIIFTNDRDPKRNKTLKNIIDAIKTLKKERCKVPELHVFVAANIQMKEDESEITIKDTDEEFVITNQNNTNTLIFSRLGVQDENECEHIVKILQDRGFLVLNPIQYMSVASNKHETALLLQKANIPQPNFTLMTKEILYDRDLYISHMKEVYKDWAKDDSENEDKEVVVKILDGHGGTGVFLTTGKKMLAILQTIFAVSPSVELIIQKKEEADGGDIRVHVLTLKDKQIILGAMKRVKIAGDFRSNVSLGATAEKVKLTKEQEQIALKAAKVSKLPWCAVDIMPLVKGSNKDVGDNVVLELNASPGTSGIGEVLGYNFVNILLSNLTNPGEFYLQDKICGWKEQVDIKWDDNTWNTYLSLQDTGNGASASCIEVGEFKIKGKKVKFNVDNKEYEFDIVDNIRIKSRPEDEANRPVIQVPSLRLGLRQVDNVKMCIVKAREKQTNILINRDILDKLGYVVSPRDTHILTPEFEKVNII